MKNIKKYLAVLMAVNILLCSLITNNAFATARTQIDSEDVVEELQPKTADMCSGMYSQKFIGEPNTTVIDSSLSYKAFIHFDSSGIADYTIHYSDHGSPGSHTNPHYHTFSFVGGWWTPNVYHPGLPN